jgi:hypothetical protein
MQPNAARLGRLIEKMTAHGFQNILANRLPGIPLGKDVFRQAFDAKTAILLLRHFKHQFVHVIKLRSWLSHRKRGLDDYSGVIFLKWPGFFFQGEGNQGGHLHFTPASLSFQIL